jgi:hypothetical protein
MSGRPARDGASQGSAPPVERSAEAPGVVAQLWPEAGWNTTGLRVPRHRATTAHLCSIYPFQAEEGLGARGVYLGTNVLAGGGAFCFDPFQLYSDGLLTSPNILVVGEVGSGKSSAIKTFLYRSIGVLGSPGGLGRWVAITDPKGEYGPLADALGLAVVRLYPGGPDRLNPLDAGPTAGRASPAELQMRRTAMVSAIVASVLHRALTPVEDAAVGWAIAALAARTSGASPELGDLAHLVHQPTEEMAARANTDTEQLARSVEAVALALGKLLERDLRGMFDGRSTVAIDWSGRGLVLDLSAVYHDPDALRLVMIAATGWLQAYLAAPDGEDVPRRVQVIEEAWAITGDLVTARYLQGCYKLSRSYGVANIAVVHRISDLRAQADDGSAAAKIAMGLLADTQTRVLFRQPTDQIVEARALLGLSGAEADLLPQLAKGRALWRVAGRAAVVQHVIGPAERAICDTDAHLLV